MKEIDLLELDQFNNNYFYYPDTNKNLCFLIQLISSYSFQL